MNARRIYYVDRKIFCDIETIPFVIYSDNLTIDGISRFVVIIAESFPVEPPFEVHRILGKDEISIIFCERNPLSIDIYFCPRNLVDYTMIVSLLKRSGFINAEFCR